MELTSLALLLLCLAIALGFEFVNGFHDTANAVATVIYTKTLKPGVAVVWSGLVNFLGVLSTLTAGAAVAFKIVNLIPTDLLTAVSGPAGIWMILSILVTAVVWNVFTWYLGIPSSSSHTMIGSILGVGLAAGWMQGKGMHGLNVDKTAETLQWLLFSPLIGFLGAGLLLLIARWLVVRQDIHLPPQGETPPPWPVRLLLIGTCTGVSYAHGSNDGQKGIGLIMLILIALLPTQFTLNSGWSARQIERAALIVRQAEPIVEAGKFTEEERAKAAEAATRLRSIEAMLAGRQALTDLGPHEQRQLRLAILKANASLKKLEKADGLSRDERETLKLARETLNTAVEFVAWWVTILVALALGIGTTVGWKRVVVTVGEKIGKAHLTYAQGAVAELTAMATILVATRMGAPVSTTHVVSSGIAGTMAANGSGIQARTIRNILLAWVLTLPVTIALSGAMYALGAGRFAGH